jgi:hypothetical protein
VVTKAGLTNLIEVVTKAGLTSLIEVVTKAGHLIKDASSSGGQFTSICYYLSTSEMWPE